MHLEFEEVVVPAELLADLAAALILATMFQHDEYDDRRALKQFRATEAAKVPATRIVTKSCRSTLR